MSLSSALGRIEKGARCGRVEVEKDIGLAGAGIPDARPLARLHEAAEDSIPNTAEADRIANGDQRWGAWKDRHALLKILFNDSEFDAAVEEAATGWVN